MYLALILGKGDLTQDTLGVYGFTALWIAAKVSPALMPRA